MKKPARVKPIKAWAVIPSHREFSALADMRNNRDKARICAKLYAQFTGKPARVVRVEIRECK